MVAVQKRADGSVNKLAHHGSSRGTWGVEKNVALKCPRQGLPASLLFLPLHSSCIRCIMRPLFSCVINEL